MRKILVLCLVVGSFLVAGNALATPINNGASIPEPASMFLFGTGLVVLAVVVRKRKTKK